MVHQTYNEQLLDAMIAHQTGLLRFAGSVRNDIWELLDASEEDLRRLIVDLAKRSGFETPARQRSLAVLLAKLRETRVSAWADANKVWFKEMRDLSLSAPEFLDNIVTGIVPVELGTVMPATEVLRDIVISQPFEGKTLRQWSDHVQRADINRIEDQVKIGLTQNEDPRQIARRIVGTVRNRGRDGVTQITRSNAAGIVRTVVSGISSEAREKYLQANKDIAPQKVFTATLDSNTTPICRRFDGQVFDVDDPAAPVFPLHFGERSLYSPALDGEVIGERPRRDFTERQLLREYTKANGLDKVTKRANLPRGTKGAYDAFARKRMRELTGRTAAKTTYQEWLKRQLAANQDDILGPTRGALFRRGGLTVDKFVLRDGTELTLRQLAQRNRSAFLKANLDPDAFK